MPDFSLADIAAATGSECKEGWGGSSAWVLIILFALIFGWGGNGIVPTFPAPPATTTTTTAAG